MPRGMHLKSEGFASNLYDPDSAFTLEAYCGENDIPYADVGLPVAIETFVAYAREFQRRYVPQLENVEVKTCSPRRSGFELTTAAGEVVQVQRVVVATGIMNFAHLPPLLADLPRSIVTHSSQHSDLSQFKGRQVAVVGAALPRSIWRRCLTRRVRPCNSSRDLTSFSSMIRPVLDLASRASRPRARVSEPVGVRGFVLTCRWSFMRCRRPCEFARWRVISVRLPVGLCAMPLSVTCRCIWVQRSKADTLPARVYV